jgi:hypothetical protein
VGTNADRASPEGAKDRFFTRTLVALGTLHVDDPIIFARPYQGYDPSNQTPSQKEIEQEDGKFVVPFAQQGDDRRQEIKDKPASKEWE